ncbi:AfsR/SARP family transcriptional regulator [Allokutzneria oryzae]|uniref:BTAD domain-containing putative transcriptional regulator n=1 Tax=Allokutzneria oryzae TaxID=1378989 RepID=A0ABV5ZR33_9PSEU
MLGPLEVRAGEAVVPVCGQRQRTVLAMLLLSPGRVVSVDSLVDAVWEGAPPATGRTQIAICVAGLRKAFKAAGCTDDVIITSSPGYKLLADEHLIDVVQFERGIAAAELAARQGLVEQAEEGMREALELWRGRVLAGVSGRVVESEAARLEELRLGVCERRTSLRLELGQHRELVGELTALVREYPLREQARACLMLAQYRLGRRAEALETFRTGRRQFIDEFGMEPGPVLQSLQRAILNDDAELTPPAVRQGRPEPVARTAPAQLPTGVAQFTGRAVELSALDSLVSCRGLSVGFVTGAAGVGKTELALRWARSVAERFPDGQLFVDLHGYDQDNEQAQPGEVLAGFLRALGVADAMIPADLGERSALFRSLLDGRRMLVVLDNAASCTQVRPLLPGAGDNVVLVTGRDQLGELLGGHGALRLRLTGLSRGESAELLGAVTARRGEAERGEAGRLAELCGGLPLALRVSAARLAAKPHWSLAHLVRLLEDDERRMDELSPGGRGVRASFESSYRRLSPSAAVLYRRLGLLDVPDFAAWVGAAVLDSGLVEAESLMEELVDAQLLEVATAADGTMRYHFQSLFRCHAREKAMLEESVDERDDACQRAFGTWLALANAALDQEEGAEVRSHLPRRVDPRELISDPASWFESERASVVAAVEQTLRMGLVLLALDLATAAWRLLVNDRPMPLSPVLELASAEGGASRPRSREKRLISKLMGELAS